MARMIIENGPGKWDLMLALLDGVRMPDLPEGKLAFRTVELTVTNGPKKWIQQAGIDSIARKGGDGENWRLTGKIMLSGKHQKFSATYDTRSRKGEMTLE